MCLRILCLKHIISIIILHQIKFLAVREEGENSRKILNATTMRHIIIRLNHNIITGHTHTSSNLHGFRGHNGNAKKIALKVVTIWNYAQQTSKVSSSSLNEKKNKTKRRKMKK